MDAEERLAGTIFGLLTVTFEPANKGSGSYEEEERRKAYRLEFQSAEKCGLHGDTCGSVRLNHQEAVRFIREATLIPGPEGDDHPALLQAREHKDAMLHVNLTRRQHLSVLS